MRLNSLKVALSLVACLAFGCNVFYDAQGIDLQASESNSTNNTTNNTNSATNNSNNVTNNSNSGTNNTNNATVCGAECDDCIEGTCDYTCPEFCNLTCIDRSECTATLTAGGEVKCDDQASCDLACLGDCAITCDNKKVECSVTCADDATCELNCGSNRNILELETCGFETCADLQDCGDGVFVCNGGCP